MNAPKIQFRKDYESFVFLTGNRPVNKLKIEKIKDDIKSGLNLLKYFPVLVFEKDDLLHVIDGQHRFNVSRDLDLPVYYVVSNELNLFQIATMNSKQDKWKESDFLNCYIELGLDDYKKLNSLQHKYKIGTAIVAELLMQGRYSGLKSTLEDFRQGNFKVNFENEAIKMLELIQNLFGRYRFFNDRSLFKAVTLISEKGLCDFGFLKDKIAQAPMMMDKQSIAKEYIYNIERVYNHKATIRKVIY